MHRIKFLLFCLLIPTLSFSQSERETNVGTSLSVELEKDLSRFLSLGLEEEVRLVDNNIGFDRSVTALGLDYSLFNKKIKVGAYYAFIYLYNNKYQYEPRHRYYFNVSYKQPVNLFTLSWRGRVQGTYRDENRGEYKINPKYVMKNKFEVDYTIWGSPWKPFLSCDLSTSLNDPVAGYELLRMRFRGGVSWRLDRTTYLDFSLRYDKYLSDDDPNVWAVGVTYKVKFL